MGRKCLKSLFWTQIECYISFVDNKTIKTFWKMNIIFKLISIFILNTNFYFFFIEFKNKTKSSNKMKSKLFLNFNSVLRFEFEIKSRFFAVFPILLVIKTFVLQTKDSLNTSSSLALSYVLRRFSCLLITRQ